MIAIVSAMTLLIGSATAAMAERIPSRAEAIETCAGVLLIGGLALLGSALPVVL